MLTVYNDTATSLSYAIIDLHPDTPSIVKGRLIDRSVSTTFYPWITSNDTHWLVVWSSAGWVNASFIKPTDLYVESYLVIADYNASYARVEFDPGSSLFILVYAMQTILELETSMLYSTIPQKVC